MINPPIMPTALRRVCSKETFGYCICGDVRERIRQDGLAD
jgi:hypothetical protein